MPDKKVEDVKILRLEIFFWNHRAIRSIIHTSRQRGWYCDYLSRMDGRLSWLIVLIFVTFSRFGGYSLNVSDMVVLRKDKNIICQ